MIRKSIIQIIRDFDAFAEPVTFRYREQPQYQSLTGGVCSIAMIIFFLAVFTNTILDTFRRTEIQSTLTTSQNQDPTLYKVGTDQFMFAVGLQGFNLTAQQKWFDIYLERTQVVSGNKTKQAIYLKPCQKQQFTKIKSDIGDVYDRIGLNSWLCPPDGTLIELQGKHSSQIFKYFKVGIKSCNPLTDPTKTCVNSSQIESYLNQNQNFQINFYYLNTIINPNNQNSTSLYLDDLNYFSFTPTDGVSANFFLSSYEIQTDQSIYPISNESSVSGGISTTPAQVLYYKVRQKDYFKLFIRKSSLSLLYQRSFRKIDDTLSYIGGLFSAVVAALFIINKFNKISYELEIAQTMYHYSKHEPLRAQSFHFLMFLAYLFYVLLSKIRIHLPWKRMQIYQNSLQQVRKQMDIRLLMKKVTYAQRMAIAVFDQPKAKILHMQEPLTLDDAKIIRKDHLLYDKLAKKYLDYKKIRKQRKQLQKLNQSSGVIKDEQIMIQVSEPKKQIKYSSEIQLQHTIMKNLAILTLSPGQKTEQQQLYNLIKKMNTFLQILKEEAQNGDMVSMKIYSRFDPKIKTIFDNTLHPEKLKNQCSILSNYTVNINQILHS